MNVYPRYLEDQVRRDLARKMVFVAGPRQVGKTTLARNLPGAQEGYLNWDADEDRERILRRQLPATDLWVFDEIHKYRAWRNFLKGLYDVRSEGQRILVAGSGRLELFGFGGDSLQGRYHLLRLHPSPWPRPGSTTPTACVNFCTSAAFRNLFSGAARSRHGVGRVSTGLV